jgi:hypothetical protein
MNKYLEDCQKKADSERITMQNDFLGQINTILANSQRRSEEQEERRAESDRKWRKALQRSNERQQILEEQHRQQRLGKALEDQQRKTQEDRARSIDGLEREIKYLERRQQQRWKELVHENTWESYEKDQEACELDTKLQNARDRIESLSEEAKPKQDVS